MSILLFAGFFILYTAIFGKNLKPSAPATVLTAPVVAPEPPKAQPAAAKAVKPTVLVVKIESDERPTKLVPLRKWATRHGIKGAGKMNLATLGEAIDQAGL